MCKSFSNTFYLICEGEDTVGPGPPPSRGDAGRVGVGARVGVGDGDVDAEPRPGHAVAVALLAERGPLQPAPRLPQAVPPPAAAAPPLPRPVLRRCYFVGVT